MPYDMIAVIKAATKRRRVVISMRSRGMTFEQIADELGVSRQRAHSLWREAIKRNGNGK